VVHKYYDI